MTEKKKDNSWIKQAKQDAKRIESAINNIMPEDGEFLFSCGLPKTFWKDVKEINTLFKARLLKEDREKLWALLQTACERAKAKQEREYASRQATSAQWFKSIMQDVYASDCDPLIGNPDIEYLKSCGKLLKKAGQDLKEHKYEMLPGHKSEIFENIKRIRTKHDAFWKAVNEGREERRRSFESRTRANIEANYERLRKASDALSRVRENGHKLDDMYSNARNDDFRSRVSGWISENDDKIRSIEASISRIEDWIHADEAKLQ